MIDKVIKIEETITDPEPDILTLFIKGPLTQTQIDVIQEILEAQSNDLEDPFILKISPI